jgi:hypothetical protein
MAGDWLKVEKDTPEKPEIAGLCAALGITPDVAFLKCFKAWRWADSNTVNGHVRRVTLEFLDSVVGLSGFSQALLDVGWLRDRNGALEFPNFTRHMGESAKQRALAANRKRRERSATCHDNVTEDSGPEKRREEKSKGSSPSGEEPAAGKAGRKKRAAVPMPPIPPELDTPEFRAAWSRWQEHRRQKRSPLTSVSVAQQFADMAAWGVARAVAAINHSIGKGWTGLFEPTSGGTQRGTPQQRMRYDPARDDAYLRSIGELPEDAGGADAAAEPPDP